MKNKLIVAGVILTCLVLLVGCGDENWKPLNVEIVNHEKGCLALEEESITALREGEDIIVTTVFSTSVPCYQIKSISAQEKEDKIEVKIKLEREEGACIECIGFQKIIFRIKNPLFYPEINLELQVEVDGQVLIPSLTAYGIR
ncbi:MAG: hypothetical protein PWP57_154 [Candidatus Atribacteria bacterium]|nr:hypothetical protein [Candidatus Atribacteria bacterium]